MNPRYISKSVLVIFVAVLACRSRAQAEPDKPSTPPSLRPNYNETGRPLPPGVPRTVDTNGNVVYVPHRFTTKLYQDAAAKLMLEEANRVAAELKLPEKLPITQSNSQSYISPFGFAYAYRMVGTISTQNYIYYVSRDNKFSYLEGAHQSQDCQGYLAEYKWPTSRVDTNAALQLAIQWLTAVHMDVAALNRDYRVSAGIDTAYVKAPPGQFVPIYFVSWKPKNGENSSVADVRLFVPTKTLMDLHVEDSKYILRKPLVFANLAELFPGVASIHTNHPVKTIYMPAPPPE